MIARTQQSAIVCPDFQEYSMQITFREQWLDTRLAYGKLGLENAPKHLTVPYIKKEVWIPDSFFPVRKNEFKMWG